MLNLAAKFTRPRTSPTETANVVDIPSQSKIRYSAQLIHDLKAQHQAMDSLYKQILVHIQKQNISNISYTLRQLYTEFQKHTMHKNVLFYCYLEQKFSQDTKALETIKEQRKEMHQISRKLSHFVRKWQNEIMTLDNLPNFSHEFNTLSVLIKQRSEHEEHKFYTMYKA